MTGTAQLAIVTFLKENNSEGDIDTAELARNNNLTATGITTALHGLLNRGVIKKALEGTKKMSTRYVLIGDLPAVEQRKTVVRRNNGLSGNLLERAMTQLADYNALQERHLAALEREKEKDKKIYQLERRLAEVEEELRTTDVQLADEQRKLIDTLQSTERNSKMIKKLEFDGRGVQRTAGA